MVLPHCLLVVIRHKAELQVKDVLMTTSVSSTDYNCCVPPLQSQCTTFTVYSCCLPPLQSQCTTVTVYLVFKTVAVQQRCQVEELGERMNLLLEIKLGCC